MIKYFLYKYIGNQMYKSSFKMSDLMRIFTSVKMIKEEDFSAVGIKETAAKSRAIQTLIENPLSKKNKCNTLNTKRQIFIFRRTKPLK